MCVSRVHYNHRSSADAFPRLPVQVGTAAIRDDSNGEHFMCMFGVADHATVVNRTRFDKRKCVVAPEPWQGQLSYRSDHVLRPPNPPVLKSYSRLLYRRRTPKPAPREETSPGNHLTRTRTGIAGTACRGSPKLPAGAGDMCGIGHAVAASFDPCHR